MAFIKPITCSVCSKTKTEVSNTTTMCNACLTQSKVDHKALFLSNLKKLTNSKRMNRLEDALYDLQYNSGLWDAINEIRASKVTY